MMVIARMKGDREQATAQISRVQSAILEASRKIEEVTLTSRNQMSGELSETMGKLAAMSESGKTLADAPRTASQVQTTVYAALDQKADDEVQRVIASNIANADTPEQGVKDVLSLVSDLANAVRHARS